MQTRSSKVSVRQLNSKPKIGIRDADTTKIMLQSWRPWMRLKGRSSNYPPWYKCSLGIRQPSTSVSIISSVNRSIFKENMLTYTNLVNFRLIAVDSVHHLKLLSEEASNWFANSSPHLRPTRLGSRPTCSCNVAVGLGPLQQEVWEVGNWCSRH